MKKYLAVGLAIMLVGCQTFYSSVVTVTEIRKSVINELGVLSRAGQISEETDKKILDADDRFKEAARGMELALIAYKAGTSTNDPITKLQEVKAPVRDMINILAPMVLKTVANKHYNNLEKATKL